MNLASKLLDIKIELDEIESRSKKLDEAKKVAMSDIIKSLGDKIEKNNTFYFPEKKSIIMVNRYDTKVYDAEIEAQVKGFKDEIKIIEKRAELENKYHLVGSYRVSLDRMNV